MEKGSQDTVVELFWGWFCCLNGGVPCLDTQVSGAVAETRGYPACCPAVNPDSLGLSTGLVPCLSTLGRSLGYIKASEIELDT